MRCKSLGREHTNSQLPPVQERLGVNRKILSRYLSQVRFFLPLPDLSLATSANSTRTRNESVQPCENNGTANRNQDRVDHAALALEANSAHDPATYDCADDTDDNVHKRPISCAAHDLASCPTRD